MPSSPVIDEVAVEDLVSYTMSHDGMQWPCLQNPQKPDTTSSLALGDEKVDKWIQEQLLSGADKSEDICVVCGKGIESTTLVPLACGHRYCTNCIIDLFEFAIYDETSFPPQCCEQRIPLANVYPSFTSEFQHTIQEKETKVWTSSRIYCHNPKCSQLLADSNLKTLKLVCAHCYSVTCTSCKAAGHVEPCQDDLATSSTIQSVAGRKYVQCCRCSGFMECSEDRDHIICFCGAGTCCQCLMEWSSCNCLRYHEYQYQGRDYPGQQALHGDPSITTDLWDIQLHYMRMAMKAYTDCNHSRQWRMITREEVVMEPWEFRCLPCDMPAQWLLQCQACRLFVCKRCKTHGVL